MRNGWVAVLMSIALSPMAAFAQGAPDESESATPTESPVEPTPQPPVEPPPQPPQPVVASPPQAEEPDDESSTRPVELGGRLFVRDTVVREGGVHELAVDSARVGVKWRDRKRGLRADIDVELSGGDAEFRDAFIRAEFADVWELQAGQFKRPFSAVALESKWELPVIERGLVSDLKLANEFTGAPDELDLGGRALGVQVQWRPSLPLRPRVYLGVFRGVAHAQIAESVRSERAPLDIADGFPEDVYGRVELRLGGDVRVGAQAAWIGQLAIAGDRDSFRHGLAGGVDVTVDAGPLRLWAEALAGRTPLHFGTALEARGDFLAARAIAALRLRIRGRLRYVEPFAMGQVVDTSTAFVETGAMQVAGGVNLGFSKTWRLQLGVEYTEVGDQLIGDRTAAVAQLGVVFD